LSQIPHAKAIPNDFVVDQTKSQLCLGVLIFRNSRPERLLGGRHDSRNSRIFVYNALIRDFNESGQRLTSGPGIYKEDEHEKWLKQLRGQKHLLHAARQRFELIDLLAELLCLDFGF
jgi:hypothetical protein